jgi:hypothetical protein
MDRGGEACADERFQIFVAGSDQGQGGGEAVMLGDKPSAGGGGAKTNVAEFAKPIELGLQPPAAPGRGEGAGDPQIDQGSVSYP